MFSNDQFHLSLYSVYIPVYLYIFVCDCLVGEYNNVFLSRWGRTLGY